MKHKDVHKGNTTGDWSGVTGGGKRDTTPPAQEKGEMKKTVRDSMNVPNAQRPRSKDAE